jgi:seryl-tRNA synthetase
MLDLKRIREEPEAIKAASASKGDAVDIERILELDKVRRTVVAQADTMRGQINVASQAIGKKKKAGENADAEMAEVRRLKEQLASDDARVKEAEAELADLLMRVPNVPAEGVPPGDETHNIEVRTWGNAASPETPVKPHWETGERLGILDLARAAKVSGSGFIVLRGVGARLERALINFMLDFHIARHGYEEIHPPFMVNSDCMRGTGQLPKLGADMYKLPEDDLWLIPTAEVPVTNLQRDEILAPGDVPRKLVAYTPCFRREAGSYGKETRGVVRVHQFDKVEMVRIEKPEHSYAALEELTNEAEEILQALAIPYRVRLLAAGDLSFAAAKCYDIEAWAPGMNTWLEVSSCSNFEDFQARRMNLRFRPEAGARPEFPHTLNGSGLALPRTVAALLENHLNADGSVTIPEPLRPYMQADRIEASGGATS